MIAENIESLLIWWALLGAVAGPVFIIWGFFTGRI